MATTEMLQYAMSIGKVLSISCHSSSTSNPAYYNAHIKSEPAMCTMPFPFVTLGPCTRAVLTNFSGNAIRFYEFFTASEVGQAAWRERPSHRLIAARCSCAPPYTTLLPLAARRRDSRGAGLWSRASRAYRPADALT